MSDTPVFYDNGQYIEDLYEADDTVAMCEGCEKTITDGQHYHVTADVVYLCEECAPMLSEIAAQYDEILSTIPFDPGELDYASPREMRVALNLMRSEIDQKGDRKVLHF